MNADDKIEYLSGCNIRTNSNNYKNEFTYLAAYSLIKKAQATGEVDKIVLERLNNRCAERMGVRPIPL